MAKQMPAVLKNFNVRIDSDSHAGTAKTIGLPELVKKIEDYRGAGMIGDVGLDLGFEKMEATINYTGVDKRHISQLMYCGVDALPIRFLGAYERQDTCTHVVRDVYMRGSVTNLPLGEMELGNINEQELTYGVTYLKVVDDGATLLEVDFVNGVYIVGGKDMTSEINTRLGL